MKIGKETFAMPYLIFKKSRKLISTISLLVFITIVTRMSTFTEAQLKTL